MQACVCPWLTGIIGLPAGHGPCSIIILRLPQTFSQNLISSPYLDIEGELEHQEAGLPVEADRDIDAALGCRLHFAGWKMNRSAQTLS